MSTRFWSPWSLRHISPTANSVIHARRPHRHSTVRTTFSKFSELPAYLWIVMYSICDGLHPSNATGHKVALQ